MGWRYAMWVGRRDRKYTELPSYKEDATNYRRKDDVGWTDWRVWLVAEVLLTLYFINLIIGGG